jgi:integrase
LAVAEAKRLVDGCAPDFRQVVQAALVTGTRYGELASLRASDFNSDSGTVRVRTSKSGKRRHLVLSDEGVAVFKSFVAGKSSERRLLVRDDGTAWTNHYRRGQWWKLVKTRRLNLRFRFTFFGIPGPPLP